MIKRVNVPDVIAGSEPLNDRTTTEALAAIRQNVRVAMDAAGYREIGASFGIACADVQIEAHGRMYVIEIKEAR